MRNSPVIRGLRRLIPYRAPDISPFERPLTDVELRSFAQRFSGMRTRAFGLPHVKIGRLLPFVRRYTDRLYGSDRALLDRIPL